MIWLKGVLALCALSLVLRDLARLGALPRFLLRLGGICVALQYSFGDLWENHPEPHASLRLGLLGLAGVLGGLHWGRRAAALPGRAILGLAGHTALGGALFLAAPRAWQLAGGGPEALFGRLLLAPAGVAVTTYLGASLAFVLWGSGRLDRRLGTEWWIGRRFLLSRSSAVLSQVTGISILGVALGVWLVLLTLGILGGFEHDLQDKIVGTGAHLNLQRQDGAPFVPSAALQARLAALQARPELDLQAISGYVAGEVAIVSDSQYTAAQMTGVNAQRAAAVSRVLSEMEPAALARLTDLAAATGPHPPIVLGREMARSLNVRPGQRVRVVSPTLEVLSPVGPTPKSRAFVVAGTFVSHMYETDAHAAFVSLGAARRFLELEPAALSGLALQCRDPLTTPAVRRAWDRLQPGPSEGAAEAPLHLGDWRERNRTLFAALELEHRVAFLVLIFIVLVASFSIVNTLTMAVLERQRDIAILKAMGAQDVSLVKIFVLQGLLIGGIGTAVGTALGVGSLLLLQKVGFAIPGEVYALDALPVRLDPGQVLAVLAAASVLVWNFAVLPSSRCARLRPVEGLRDG